MGHLLRRLRRNIGGVTVIVLTDLIWRTKNLLALSGVGIGLAQFYSGAGLLLSGSFVASLTAVLLGGGGLLAGAVSFFDRPVAGGVALLMVVAVIVAGPAAAVGAAETTYGAAVDIVETGDDDVPANNVTAPGDLPSQEDDDDVRVVARGGDTAADGCGTNDGDPDYNEDNDRDNDGLCDE